jgi:hypothetical protein
MYSPDYPSYQNDCKRCVRESEKEIEHAEELAKAKKQSEPEYFHPIVDGKYVAEIEVEELRGELADLRATISAATEELRRRHVAPLLGQSLSDAIRAAFENGESHFIAVTERAEKAEHELYEMTKHRNESVAALAGEAKSAEALKRVGQQLDWIIENGSTYQGPALVEFVSRIRHNYFPLSTKPPLDWLEDQKREAAAKALEEAADLIRQTTPSPGEVELWPLEIGRWDGRGNAVLQIKELAAELRHGKEQR